MRKGQQGNEIVTKVSIKIVLHVLVCLIFASTLASNSSRVSLFCGKRFLYKEKKKTIKSAWLNPKECLFSLSVEECLTAANHLRISSLVHVSGSPLGSSCAGNMSPPKMDQAAAATTTPPKALFGVSDKSRVDLKSPSPI
ncbi:hypothetical protein V8C37DRAFT_374222 [Trichoderma ceciliae]